MPVSEAGRRQEAVFSCSYTVAGNVLFGNKAYRRVVTDYRMSFTRLTALKADVVLPPHPEMADVLERNARQGAGQANAFIDPEEFQHFLAASRIAFEAELARLIETENAKGLPPP